MTKRYIIWKDVSGDCRVERGEITGLTYVYHHERCIACFNADTGTETLQLDYYIQEVDEPEMREP